MSGQVSLEYTVVFVWLKICSVYTTLLTVTALCIAFIFRKQRSPTLKSSPQAALVSERQRTKPSGTTRNRRVSFSKRNDIAEFITNDEITTWKSFYEEWNKKLKSPGNKLTVNNSPRSSDDNLEGEFEDHFEEALSNCDDSKGVESFDNNVKDYQFTSECERNDGHPDVSGVNDQPNKMPCEALSIDPHEDKNIWDKIIPTLAPGDDNDHIQVDPNIQAAPGLLSACNMSGYMRNCLNINDPAASGQRSENRTLDLKTTGREQNISKNLEILQYSQSEHANNLTFNKTTQGNDRDITLRQPKSSIIKIISNRIVFCNSSGNVCTTPPLLTDTAAEKLENFNKVPQNGFEGDISVPQTLYPDKNFAEPDVPKNHISPENIKTIVIENEAGNISITESIPEKIALDANKLPVPIETKTFIYKTDSGNISVTQILPSTTSVTETNKKEGLVFGDTGRNNKIPSNIVSVGDEGKQTRNKDLKESDACAPPSSSFSCEKNISTCSREANLSNMVLLDEVKKLPNANSETPSISQPIIDNNDTPSNDKVRNISQTKAISLGTILLNKSTLKGQNIVRKEYSETCKSSCSEEALSANVILSLKVGLSIDNKQLSGEQVECAFSRPKMIIAYESDERKIPMTQSLPTKIISSDKINNFDSNENENNLLTKANPSLAKRNTISCNEEYTNVSFVEEKIRNLLPEMEVERNSFIYDDADISARDNSVHETLSERKVQSNKSVDKFESNQCSVQLSEQIVVATKIAEQNIVLSKKPESFEQLHPCAGDIFLKANLPTMYEEARLVKDEKSKELKLSSLQESEKLIKLDSKKGDALLIDFVQPNNNTNTSISYSEDPNYNQVIKDFRRKNKDSSKTRFKYGRNQSKSILKPNSIKNPSLQRILLGKTNYNGKISEDGPHLQDMIVYQTATTMSAMVPEKLENETVLSTIPSKTESEVESLTADGENIINADFVTVTHRIPIPSLDMDLVINETDKEQKNSNSNSDPDDSFSSLENFSQASQICSPNVLNKTIEKSILNDLLDMGIRSDTGIMEEIIMKKASNTNVENIANTDSKCTINSASGDKLFDFSKYYSDYETKLEKYNSVEDMLKNHINDCLKAVSFSHQFTQTEIDDGINAIQNEPCKLQLKHDTTTNFNNEGLKDVETTREMLDILTKLIDLEEKDSPIKSILGKLVNNNKMNTVTGEPVSLLQRDSNKEGNFEKAVGMEPDRGQLGQETFPSTNPTPKTNNHTNQKVVKSLRFQDDMSSCDHKDNITTALRTPFKKITFEETFNVDEEFKKGRVIPSYLKDVSDNLKALMTDLVKPMVDVIPLENRTDRVVKQKVSTCSMQIQANIISSSQIDLVPEMSPSKYVAPGTIKLKSIIKSHDESNAGSGSSNSASDRSFDSMSGLKKYIACNRVLQFDPGNPLNNVLLGPNAFHEVHKYKPLESDISVPNRFSNVSFKNIDTDSDDTVITQYNIHSVIPNYFKSKYFRLPPKKSLEAQNIPSSADLNVFSMNQSLQTDTCTLKDENINTDIAMQDNEKLLKYSSSLTLVDSKPDESKFVRGTLNINSLVLSQKNSKEQFNTNMLSCWHSNTPVSINSPTRTMYSHHSNFETNICNQDVLGNKVNNKKVYDKKKFGKCSMSDWDIAQTLALNKPFLNLITATDNGHKIPKHRSNSDITADRETGRISRQRTWRSEKSPRSKSLQSKPPTMNIDIQQLKVEYNTEVDTLNPAVDASKESVSTDERSSVIKSISSHSSDKSGSKDMGDANSFSIDMEKDKGFPMDWQPALHNEQSSKNLLTESESSADVVNNIDSLPFMGNSECAWESSSGNEWRFHLLHMRLRLVVRLGRTDDAGCVRADTPLRAVFVESTQAVTPKTNAVGILCLRFATKAIEHFVRLGCVRAGDVPALLRRCAAIARIALRWGRTMHDSWIHLAYQLDHEGILFLNVANVTMLSVWDVSMKIELVEDDPHEVPWPRAVAVRVTPVVNNVVVTPGEVQRAISGISQDWGHAPRTLWAIYRYLISKTQGQNTQIITRGLYHQ